jgi:serine/threonine protein kinase
VTSWCSLDSVFCKFTVCHFCKAMAFAAQYSVGHPIMEGWMSCTRLSDGAPLMFRSVNLQDQDFSSPVSVAAAKHEAQILRRLAGHPGVLQYVDAFEDAQNFYAIAQPYKVFSSSFTSSGYLGRIFCNTYPQLSASTSTLSDPCSALYAKRLGICTISA